MAYDDSVQARYYQHSVAGHIVPTVRKQSWVLVFYTLLLLFIQSGMPAHGMMTPTLRVDPPSPVKLFWKFSKRHIRDVFYRF